MLGQARQGRAGLSVLRHSAVLKVILFDVLMTGLGWAGPGLAWLGSTVLMTDGTAILVFWSSSYALIWHADAFMLKNKCKNNIKNVISPQNYLVCYPRIKYNVL